MRVSRRLNTAAAAAFTAAALASAVPSAAEAAPGFTTPVRLSATADAIDLDGAVVAPTGRTAVLWRTADFTTRLGEYALMVATGPDPAHLGPPTELKVARRFAKDAFFKSLHAFPDGSLSACFQTDPRKGDAVAGCTFAPPAGGFGPVRVFNRISWATRPQFAAYPRPDGRLALLLSHRVRGGKRAVESRLLSPDGSTTGLQRLATVSQWQDLRSAGADDGSVAVSWVEGEASTADGRTLDPGESRLAVLPGSAEQFGPPLTVEPQAEYPAMVELSGGRRLVAAYTRQTGKDSAQGFSIVGADGSLGPFRELPRATGRTGFYTSVLVLQDGTPFALTNRYREDGSDCDMYPYSTVGAGSLGAPGTVAKVPTLSDRKQIAGDSSAAELADGTIIVAWSNLFRMASQERLEVAVRKPGATAFSAPRVLPQAAGEWQLAASENHALLVWEVSKGFDQPAYLVTSAFTRTGPLAPQAKRPTHPEGNCG